LIDNYYVFKKEVDWSLLNQGISIPLDIQVIFQNNVKKFIARGESKDIFLLLDGISYKAKLVNQKFDEVKYPTHRDILQIRYSPNSTLSAKLRDLFSTTFKYICEQRANQGEKQKLYFKIPDGQKEYLAIYTTEYTDTFLVECITQNAALEAKAILQKEEEANYEATINYPILDPTASIEKIQLLAKIRKLNRAIGDNLKILYDYKCQICGQDFGSKYEVHVVESHHIVPFTISMNNDAANQVIICPNHHRVIHKAEAVFDKSKFMFIYSNGIEEKLILNKHLLV
jgi:predicted HNH restriction endonuclease